MPWLLRMTLVVSGIMAIAHLYLGWRLTKASGFLSNHAAIRWLPMLVLFTFYSLPITGVILYTVTGHLNVLEISKPVTYWFWFGLTYSYQLVSWVIVLDLIKAGFHIASSWDTTYINTLYGRIVVAVAAVIMVFSGLKMYRDTTGIETKTMELSVKDLPSDFEGLCIVHISDIQGDQYTGAEEIARYIEQVNAQDPDLVIFTGDLISYGTDFIGMSAGELSGINATYGTYAVVGDHDYWAGLTNVEPALEGNGIPLLRDENRFIKIGSDSLLLTGITQVYSKRAEPENVKRLTSGSTSAAFKILASHQVSDVLLREAQANNYNMILAGHTHGGQVRIPLFGMTFSASDFETEFVSGTYWRGDLLININNGLGFTLAPVRYNAPPSITVIELRKK